MSTVKFQRTDAFRRRRSRLQTRSFSSTITAAEGNRRTHTRSNSTTSVDASSFGECCGGTTAECVAISCCFPLAIADLLAMAVYKIPAGICRRAIRRNRRRKLLKKGLVVQPCNHGDGGCDGGGFQIHPVDSTDDLLTVVVTEEAETGEKKLENEMLQRFSSMGFGRSFSQTERESSGN